METWEDACSESGFDVSVVEDLVYKAEIDVLSELGTEFLSNCDVQWTTQEINL